MAEIAEGSETKDFDLYDWLSRELKDETYQGYLSKNVKEFEENEEKIKQALMKFNSPYIPALLLWNFRDITKLSQETGTDLISLWEQTTEIVEQKMNEYKNKEALVNTAVKIMKNATTYGRNPSEVWKTFDKQKKKISKYQDYLENEITNTVLFDGRWDFMEVLKDATKYALKLSKHHRILPYETQKKFMENWEGITNYAKRHGVKPARLFKIAVDAIINEAKAYKKVVKLYNKTNPDRLEDDGWDHDHILCFGSLREGISNVADNPYLSFKKI